MRILDSDFSVGLQEAGVPPCLSLYQPTHRHHPENQQDPIRFRNLTSELEKRLLKLCTKQETHAILEPLRALGQDHDFWNHTLDGLVVFGAPGFSRVYGLQRPVAELVIIADSFHTSPLIRILQSVDRYQVLGLSRHEAKLYEGNRDALDEIELAEGVPRSIVDALGEELTESHQTVAAYGGAGDGQGAMHHGHGGRESDVDSDAERFFRAVDRGVLEHHSRRSDLPLILAALPEHHHLFHQVSANPFLIEEGIHIHPDALSSTDELRQLAWEVFEPRYRARLAALSEDYARARALDLGDDQLPRIAKATIAGRVATLLIEADREIPGRLDAVTGNVTLADPARPEVDDVLDDLGTLALKMGGNLVILPSEGMPTDTGVAAIYRY
jgi:hypothetical protein